MGDPYRLLSQGRNIYFLECAKGIDSKPNRSHTQSIDLQNWIAREARIERNPQHLIPE